MSFELFISKRYIRAKQKQALISLITALSIAGITVGVMALIVVIAVMAGFESDLKARILGIESHVIVMRHGGSFYKYQQVLEDLNKADDIKAATPFVYSQIMLRSAYGISGAVLRGIDPVSAGNVIKIKEEEGREKPKFQLLKPDSEIPGIILGGELAGNLGGIREGDIIYLISPRGMISPMGHLPAMKRFKVADIFKSGMYEYDSSLAYIHMKDAQNILRTGDSVTGIEVSVRHIYDAKKIAERIKKELGFPYWTKDWMQMNQNLFSALKLEKTVMFIILTLIILVAAFNIASSLIMMVMEKTKDIAILKVMGTTDKSIRRIFVCKGMAIGSVGTTLGVCLGFLLCTLLEHFKFIDLPSSIYYINKLPVQLEALDVFMIASAAMVISFLATLYPATKASKLNPVEALRYG